MVNGSGSSLVEVKCFTKKELQQTNERATKMGRTNTIANEVVSALAEAAMFPVSEAHANQDGGIVATIVTDVYGNEHNIDLTNGEWNALQSKMITGPGQ